MMSEPGDRLTSQSRLYVDQELPDLNRPLDTIPTSLPRGPEPVAEIGHACYGYDDCVQSHLRDQSAQLESRAAAKVNVYNRQVKLAGVDQPDSLLGGRYG